jgi:3-dehydroquinate dehydratase-2
MTRTVLVLNGPNINLLGTREPGIYGAQTLADVKELCARACEPHGLVLDFRQSNHEGQLVDWLQEAGQAEAAGSLAGVVFNAAAYTHTSVALRDAREEFRHHSYLSAVARGVMFGFGTAGYALAIAAVAGWDRDKHPVVTA